MCRSCNVEQEPSSSLRPVEIALRPRGAFAGSPFEQCGGLAGARWHGPSHPRLWAGAALVEGTPTSGCTAVVSVGFGPQVPFCFCVGFQFEKEVRSTALHNTDLRNLAALHSTAIIVAQHREMQSSPGSWVFRTGFPRRKIK